MQLAAQAHPLHQLQHVLAIGRRLLPGDAQGQGDIVEGAQVIQQAELLKHHPDAAPQLRQGAARRGRQGLAEQIDQPARGPLGHVDQLEQRALARAGRAGEEMERARLQVERDVAQGFGRAAIAHAHPGEAEDRLVIPAVWALGRDGSAACGKIRHLARVSGHEGRNRRPPWRLSWSDRFAGHDTDLS